MAHDSAQHTGGMSDNGTPLGVQNEAARHDSAHAEDDQSIGIRAEVRLSFDTFDKERIDWFRDHVHADVVLHGVDEHLMHQDSQAAARAGVPADAASRNDAGTAIAGDGGLALTFVNVPIIAISGPAGMTTRNADTLGDGPCTDAAAFSAPFDESGEAVPGVGMPAARRAVVAMQSKVRDAERRFRSAVVSLDAVPGTQIDGISPLYHVSNLDGPDAMAAVVQLSTTMPPKSLAATLHSLERTHEGGIALTIVDMEGVSINDPDFVVPWPEAGSRASVLAPWMDMDPEAQFGGRPVSFLLALAPDAMRVGLLSDNWIIGDTRAEQPRQGSWAMDGMRFGEPGFGEPPFTGTQLGGIQ